MLIGSSAQRTETVLEYDPDGTGVSSEGQQSPLYLRGVRGSIEEKSNRRLASLSTTAKKILSYLHRKGGKGSNGSKSDSKSKSASNASSSSARLNRNACRGEKKRTRSKDSWGKTIKCSKSSKSSGYARRGKSSKSRKKGKGGKGVRKSKGSSGTLRNCKKYSSSNANTNSKFKTNEKETSSNINALNGVVVPFSPSPSK